jgi:uncharacterized protein (DUF4415 family)
MSKVPESIREELAVLAERPDSEIDFSDIPATAEKDWLNAERGRFYKPIKQRLTVSLDDDVLEWLKGQGDDYRTRVNEVLRNAMLHDLRRAG